MLRSVILVSATLVIACGGTHDSTQTPPTGAVASHTIKVYDVTHGNKVIQFGQIRQLSSTARRTMSTKSMTIDKSLENDGGPYLGDSGIQVDSGPTVTISNGSTILVEPSTGVMDMTYLASAAASICAAGNSNGDGAVFVPQMGSAEVPWSNWENAGAPSIFEPSARPNSCDDMLFMAQTLYCAASMMSNAADSVSGVNWAAPGGGTIWFIPPQASADKYLLRTAALQLLGDLATIDNISFIPNGGGSRITCQTLYQENLNNNEPNDYSYNVPPGNKTCYPLVPVPDGKCNGLPNQPGSLSVIQVVQDRINSQVQMLAATLDIIDSLVKENVTEELGQIAKANESAGDPVTGNQNAWGVDLQDNLNMGQSGTFSDVADFLFTRHPTFDPSISGSTTGSGFTATSLNFTCNDAVSAPLVLPTNPGFGAYGPDLIDRIDYIPAATATQQDALQRVESLGLVTTMDISTLQSALIDLNELQLANSLARRSAVLQTTRPRLSKIFGKAIRF